MSSMMSQPRVKFTAVALVVALVAACGAGPKSQALDDLERQLQDPSANEVKDAPGASKAYREARQYRRLALESWEDGKDEVSEEYAILGMLRYRTAAAIFDQHAAKARLDAANSQVTTANPAIKALNDEQLKLADEVQQLEMQVAQERRRKEEAERRANAIATQQEVAAAGNNSAQLQQLRTKITEVETAQRTADAVDAATHAPDKYNPAANLLKSVKTLAAGGNSSAAIVADAERALTLFREAEQAAKPEYARAQEKLNPAARRQKLAAEADVAFGGSNVIREPAGVRIVLPSAFGTGSTTIAATQDQKIASLVALAKSYDEFTIYVEGFTRRGDATENLGISQLRARAVKDRLTGGGIANSRVETKGLGQDQPRFGASSPDNDRVEVVFTR